MAGAYDDEEIRRKPRRQSRTSREPDIHAEAEEHGEEADQIEEDDPSGGAVAVTQERERLQQGISLVVASSDLVIGHAAEHGACPPGVVPCLFVEFHALLGGVEPGHLVACEQHLPSELGAAVDESHCEEKEDCQQVGSRFLEYDCGLAL